MKHREGFTFVELLTTMILLGILAGIAILKWADLKNAALTSAIAGDFRAVHLATFNYWADKGSWPSDVGAGTMPNGLAPYLPDGFTWVKPTYTLDYEEFPVGSNVFVVGVAVTSPDPKLMSKLIQNLGTRSPFYLAGGSLTYIIIGPEGLS